MKIQKHSQGFTLVELLLGITISVMIFLTATSVLSLLFRSDVKTKRIDELEQAKNDLSAEFSNKIRWASNITYTNGANATLSIDESEYTLSNERVLKGDQPLTPASVAVKKLQVTNYSNNPLIKSLEIVVEMESKNNSSVKQSVRIIASQRKTRFEE